MLLDSNIFILAATGQHDSLLTYFEGGESSFSAASRVEVLGYTKLDPDDEDELRQLLDMVTKIDITDAVIEKAVQLRKRRKMSLGDALIAGTAVLHGLSLVTANEVDFSWIDELDVINPLRP